MRILDKDQSQTSDKHNSFTDQWQQEFFKKTQINHKQNSSKDQLQQVFFTTTKPRHKPASLEEGVLLLFTNLSVQSSSNIKYLWQTQSVGRETYDKYLQNEEQTRGTEQQDHTHGKPLYVEYIHSSCTHGLSLGSVRSSKFQQNRAKTNPTNKANLYTPPHNTAVANFNTT